MASKEEANEKSFKLVAAFLKEAALDSPSFRAVVNHLDIQISNIEKWIVAVSSSVKKLPRYVQELETFSNSFLEHLVPPFIQDGIIDQEYTVRSLRLTVETLRRLWNLSLQAIRVHTKETDNLETKVASLIRKYKEMRQRFETCQSQFERYCRIYLSTPTARDVRTVTEDYKRLRVARVDYLHESLAIMVEVIVLGRQLDESLIRMCGDLWKDKAKIFKQFAVFEEFEDINQGLCRIQEWNEVYSVNNLSLFKNLIDAKNQIQRTMDVALTSTLNINDFNVSLINSKSLADIDECSYEKHGYLFMKTYEDKSNKAMWVRRWASIKNGLFGILMLSPSKTSVQETDKIGVLLCQVRYAPDENRRFCFELKTVDMTLVFQTETLLDLKSWLKVFKNETERVLRSDNEELYNLASERFPPILKEFACSFTSSADKDLTHAKTIGSRGQQLRSAKLAKHIERNKNKFQTYVYYQIPLIRPPIITENTKSAIIAYTFVSSLNFSSALTANIWGSLNWGLYYLHSTEELDVKNKTNLYLNEELNSIIRGENAARYDETYPPSLLPFDIQMRSLFETAVGAGEICLLSFSSVWMPHKNLLLNGRIFVTNDGIYCYIQTFGFTSLYKGKLNNFVSVEGVRGEKNDVLKLYTLRGLIQMKIYIGDVKLIEEKLLYLINDKANNKPRSLHELIDGINQIDKNYQSSRLQLSLAKNKTLSSTSHIPSIVITNESQEDIYKTDYSDGMRKTYDIMVDLPPKAVFHVLLGHKSDILTGGSQILYPEGKVKCPWILNEDGTLQRGFLVPVRCLNSRGTVYIEQNVQKLVDNVYYNFTHTISGLKFMSLNKFRITYRLIIIENGINQSKFLVYSKFLFENKFPIINLFTVFYYRNYASFGSHMCQEVREAAKKIGSQGPVMKSILLYGNLEYASNPIIVSLKDASMSYGLLALCEYLCKKVLLLFVQFFANLFIISKRGARQLFIGITLHGALLCLLIFSGVLNFLLMGKATKAYWSVHTAEKMAEKFLVSNEVKIRKSVYIKDYEELISGIHGEPIFRNSSSKCYEAFKNNSFSINFDKYSYWNQDYASEFTRQSSLKLKSAFDQIGIKREQLLLDLTMLNQMEREIRMSEWKSWLSSEIERCYYFKNQFYREVIRNGTQDAIENMMAGFNSVFDYCRSCASDLKHVDEL